jgi:hypothetical protein
MTTPIEQRKDLFEISTDLNLMISYRKAIMDSLPRAWVIIHKNQQTNNYGLEVMNSLGNACTPEETLEIKQIISNYHSPTSPVRVKKSRKKKEVIPS